jgi:hypothetical protein
MDDEALDLSLDKFRWRLAETIAWCSKRAKPDDPKDSLRHPQLRPPSFWYATRDLLSPISIVEDFMKLRAIELIDWRGESMVKAPADNLAGGRLLAYFPFANLADCAAEAESGGFFNSDNEPPWDTWLCFLDDAPRLYEHDVSYQYYLISWIPPQFIDVANAGIEVNPEMCIQWASEVESPFVGELRKAGLL